MMAFSSTIKSDQLDLVHRDAIESPAELDRILRRLRDEGIALYRGMNKDVLPESARLVEITGDRLSFETQNFADTGRSQRLPSIQGFLFLT